MAVQLDGSDDVPGGGMEQCIPLYDVSRPKMSLQQAARDGREDIVKYYLDTLSEEESQQIINARDSEGYTALHYAAKFNRFQIMVRLITHDADPDPQSAEEKFTPLHFSCRYLPNIYDDDTIDYGEGEHVTTVRTCRKAVQLLVNRRDLDVNAKNIYGVASLHMACSRGNTVALEELLTSPSLDLYITDNHGDTALHEACLLGNVDIVEMLLTAMDKNGINVLLPNHDKQTPLHFACKKGFVDIVKLILRYGKHQMQELVCACDTEGNTPLHFAAESGKSDIVKCIMICRAADIEARKHDETTPLHIACRHGRLEVATLIVAYSKNTMSAEDMYQQTSLHFAAKNNHCNLIEFLLEQGAEIDAQDVNLSTPLLVAAANGQVDAIRTLTRWKADVDVLDKNKRSAVYIACEYKHATLLKALLLQTEGHKPILSDAEIKALCRTADSVHNTPLHVAAMKGHPDVVKILLTTDVKVDARNDVGKTPLHLAAEAGHAAIVRSVIQFDPETIYDEDHDANSPLQLACLNGQLEVARVLMDANCAIENRNSKLWTPLDCAAATGNDELVIELIKNGADINPTEKDKVTPLHLAASEGHLKVVQVLLKNGADVSQTDQQGDNALDLAIDNGHESIAMAIIQSPKWESALRNTTFTPSKDQTTPLRKLIRKMPKVTEEVFKLCTVSESSTVADDNEENNVYFNYEFLEDFRDPPRRTLRATIQDYGTLSPNIPGDSSDPKSSSATDREDARADMVTKLKLREKKHSFTTSWGPVGFKKSRHPLSIMVDAERTELLKHPLALSLLAYKWETYGRYIYYSNLFIYALFIIFLTAFALLVPHPGTRTCKAVASGDFGSNVTVAADTDQDLTSEERNILEGSCDSELNVTQNFTLRILSVFVILFSLIRLIMELFQAIQLRLVWYALSWVNWLEVLVFCSSIFFVTTFFSDCLCPTVLQWQVGVVAIFLAWVALIIFIRKLPGTGIYVVMFLDIFYTFWRLFFLSILLVIAFGLAFFMAFYEPNVNRTSFATPARSLLKTITMTTGEFGFDPLFRQAPGGVGLAEIIMLGEIPYPHISYILWIAFIILMPILLSNLLVGLAVDDIKGILNAAVLKRLALQVELAVSVEELLPRRMRRWLIIGSRKVQLNRKLTILERIGSALSGKERFDSSENIAKALKPTLSPIEQVKLQNEHLLSEMDQTKRNIAALQGTNKHLLSKMDQIKQNIAALQGTIENLVSLQHGHSHPASRSTTPIP